MKYLRRSPFVLWVVLLYASLLRAQVSAGDATVPPEKVLGGHPENQTAVWEFDHVSARADDADSAHLSEMPPITVHDLVDIALSQNPMIKGAAEHTQAERARAPQMRSLPDPTVSVGWMGNIAPFSIQRGDPSSYRGITVGQDFPFPGTLALRGKIAEREAEAAGWDAEQVRRQVVSDVKVAYYNYFYYTKAIEITGKNKGLLQKLERIAEARYRVGKGIQQDVLRAQVEVSRIDQAMIVLEQQLKTIEVRLNTLLDQDPETPLAPPAVFEPGNFHSSLSDLYAMAHSNDPMLERDRSLISSSSEGVDLAKKAYKPNFSVGYTYEERPGLPSMQGVMVGINVPIFFRTKQREGVIEANHRLASARQALDGRMTAVEFEIKQQYLTATTSRDLMTLYSKGIVPQASLALESSMSSYEVGKVEFLSILDNFIYVLDYEVNYYQELSNFQIALARLEPLINTELTGTEGYQ